MSAPFYHDTTIFRIIYIFFLWIRFAFLFIWIDYHPLTDISVEAEWTLGQFGSLTLTQAAASVLHLHLFWNIQYYSKIMRPWCHLLCLVDYSSILDKTHLKWHELQNEVIMQFKKCNILISLFSIFFFVHLLWTRTVSYLQRQLGVIFHPSLIH